MQRAGEGTFTSREIVARAEALRPALLERQAETEELTYYPESTHQDFLEAGFYRILQPRRYGGLELDVPAFVRVIIDRESVLAGADRVQRELGGADVMLTAPFSSDQRAEHRRMVETNLLSATTATPPS